MGEVFWGSIIQMRTIGDYDLRGELEGLDEHGLYEHALVGTIVDDHREAC